MLGEKPGDEGCMERNASGAQEPWSLLPGTATVSIPTAATTTFCPTSLCPAAIPLPGTEGKS